MPGKNYLTKKALQHRCREAGLSTSGTREDMLRRLNSQNSDDVYISAENQSLQKKIVELEKTVRELQERSFHPSVISSPIEKAATVNEDQPANGSETTSDKLDEKRQQQPIDLRSNEMHVQKVTNLPNIDVATSQPQLNEIYPPQRHNMHFATSQQSDVYPTQPRNMQFATSQQNDVYPTQPHNMHFATSQRNVIYPTQTHNVHFSTSQKFTDCATSQPNVNNPVTYSNFGNFVTSGNDFNQGSTFPRHQPMYNEYPYARASHLDNRIPAGNEHFNHAYGNFKMSKTNRDSTELPSDYFYKMLALGKKEISKSISVNGNETIAFVDPGSTRTLIRKSFAESVGVLQRCAVTLNGFGDSPYASGIVVVEKQNGEHRLCVDYRRLNSITVKIPFPMPNLEEQFAQLAGNTYFSQLDLRMGYHQIEVCESSKQFTAFVTSDGHYEYNRMPFGLVNAPAVFQAVMNKIVKRMEPVLVLYDFAAHHEVHTDACAIGLAGVLLQSQDKTNWRPVCYFSRHCTDAESRYHSYELETLAVVETLQRFRVYILGKPFRLVTDCSAIAKVKLNKELSRTLVD
nr:uncharacterized protein LOC121501839 [Drosophila kikkawai]